MNKNALDFALELLDALPLFIQAGQNASDLIQQAKDMRDSGQDPTPGQWDDLNARIGLLRGDLHSDEH